MANYTTSNGVQQFTITIAAGQTTGTASINAVGAGAAIIYDGVNPSVSTDGSEGYAYLGLTNPTTITATRNNGTAGTVVITGCIIDGDTTNLMKSVTYGTLTISSGSLTGTASIPAVTNSNTAIHFLGHSTAGTSWSAAVEQALLSLSGTTVTGTRVTNTSTIIVGFCAAEFQSSALNQAVQAVNVTTSASVTSWTAAVTSVNVNNSLLIYSGQDTAAGTNGQNSLMYGVLTSSTVITANVKTGTTNTRTWGTNLVELASGVLNSAVQRGTTTVTAGNATAVATLSAVNTLYAGVSYLGNNFNAGPVNLAAMEGDIALSSTTTATVTRNATTNIIVFSWEGFEFPVYVAAAWPQAWRVPQAEIIPEPPVNNAIIFNNAFIARVLASYVDPVSFGPLSANPISGNTLASAYSATIAVTQAASAIAITDAEDFIASLGLAPANPTTNIAGITFNGSIGLTQGTSSITLNEFNGIAPWSPAPVDNTRRRQQNVSLQELRQNAPSLTQIRQSLPLLGD